MEITRHEESEDLSSERDATTRHPWQAEGPEETVDEALKNDDLTPTEPPD